MKTMKKIMSVILVAVLMVMLLPVNAKAASSDDFIMIETVKEAPIRVSAKKKAAVLSTAEAGTLLMAVDTTYNTAGNLWYKVIDITSGKNGFIYAGNVALHECQYKMVSGSETLAYCHCGNICAVENSSTMRIADAAAVPTPLIDPDFLNALRDMGMGLSAAASAYVPYLSVAVACGTFVYLVVGVTKHAAVIEDIGTEWTKLNKDYRPDEGIFYNAYSNRRAFYIDVANPMDMGEALDVIDVSLMVNTVFGETEWSVYTYSQDDAINLANSYVKQNPGFELESTDPDAHFKGSLMKQFLHYHIVPTFDPFKGDHMGGHICFGSPALNTFNNGAWA